MTTSWADVRAAFGDELDLYTRLVSDLGAMGETPEQFETRTCRVVVVELLANMQVELRRLGKSDAALAAVRRRIERGLEGTRRWRPEGGTMAVATARRGSDW